MNQTETHYRVLRHLEANPEITQRELAQEMGVSVGKVNYCIKALVQKGWVKANNFKNNKNKAAYAYLLTPTGIEQPTDQAPISTPQELPPGAQGETSATTVPRAPPRPLPTW